MIKVQIGDDEKYLQNLHEGWVNQQINRGRRGDEPVCVRVTINEPPIDMVLSTPGCPSGPGGSRALNTREREVFELWGKHKLNSSDFGGGNLLAFLRRVS